MECVKSRIESISEDFVPGIDLSEAKTDLSQNISIEKADPTANQNEQLDKPPQKSIFPHLLSFNKEEPVQEFKGKSIEEEEKSDIPSLIQQICKFDKKLGEELLEEFRNPKKSIDPNNMIEDLGFGGAGIITVYYDDNRAMIYALKKMKSSQNVQSQIREIENLKLCNRIEQDWNQKKEKNKRFFLEIVNSFFDVESINGTTNASLSLIMEMCDSNLGEYLNYLTSAKNQAKQQEEEKEQFENIIFILHELLDMVEILSESGYAYSDMKLENILIKRTSEGKNQLKFGDCGTLVSYQDYIAHGRLYGCTPGYIPENWTNRSLSREEFFKVDVYAIGIVLDKLIKCFLRTKPKNSLLITIMEELRSSFVSKLVDTQQFFALKEYKIMLQEFMQKHHLKLGFFSVKYDFYETIILKKNANAFSKNRKNLEETIQFYENIGFYDRAIIILRKTIQQEKKLSEDRKISYLIQLVRLYSIMGQRELRDSLTKQIKQDLLERKKGPKDIIYFMIQSFLYSESQENEKVEAEKSLDEILIFLKEEKLTLRDFYTQETAINLLFGFLNLKLEKKVMEAILFLENEIKRQYICPNFKKLRSEKDVDRVNYFLMQFYSQKVLSVNNFFSYIEKYSENLKIIAKENVEVGRMAVNLGKTIYFENSSTMSRIYNNLGCALQKAKLYQEALEFHKKSYKIRKLLVTRSPELKNYDMDFINIPKMNIGTCYFAMKMYDKSLKIYKQIYAERKKKYEKNEKNHPRLVQIAEKLALNLKVMKNFVEIYQTFDMAFILRCIGKFLIWKKKN